MSFLLFTLAFAKPPAWVLAEPLTADSRAIRKAAVQTNSSPDVLILLDEIVYGIDALGRRRLTKRLIWQLLDQEARKEWSTLTTTWSPWRQERPVIQARILHPDGTEIPLDPSTILETKGGANQEVYDGPPTLTLPLPHIEVGTIVEELLTWTDTQPYLGGGDSIRTTLAGSYPRPLHVVRRIEVDEKRPLEWRVFGGKADVHVKKENGKQILSTHIREPEPPPDINGLPPGKVPYPTLFAKSTEGWAAIGAAYSEQIGDALTPEGLDASISQLRSLPENDRLGAAYRMVRDKIRYTGVEFGKHAIVPYRPADVLTRGYGDSKDKAGLLVSLLNAIGIDARLALIDAQGYSEIYPDWPDVTTFNHAIVFIPSLNTWLDPTDELRPVEELPLRDQDRWALVIDGEASELRKTPGHTSEDAKITHLRTYSFKGMGGPEVIDSTTDTTGWMTDRERKDIWDLDEEDLTMALTSWLKKNVGASYTSHRGSPIKDPDSPFHLTIYGKNAETGTLTFMEIALSLPSNDDLLRLPDLLIKPPEGYDLLADRDLPFYFAPFQGTTVFSIEIPAGYQLVEGPEDLEIQIGSFHFHQVLKNRGTQLELTQFLDTGNGWLTAEEARQVREALLGAQISEITMLWRHDAVNAARFGQLQKAFKILHEAQESHPENALPWGTETHLLSHLGLRDAALHTAETYLSHTSDPATAWALIGSLSTTDAAGRSIRGPFERKKALVALKKAVELNPNDLDSLQDLAVMQEFGADQVRWGRDVDFEALLTTFEQRQRLIKDEHLAPDIAMSQLAGGHCDAPDLDGEQADLPLPLKIAIIACREGADAALDFVRSQTTRRPQQTTAVEGAVRLLFLGERNWTLAGELHQKNRGPNASSDLAYAFAAAFTEDTPRWQETPDIPTYTYLKTMGFGAEGVDVFLSYVTPEAHDSPKIQDAATLTPLRKVGLPIDVQLNVSSH